MDLLILKYLLFSLFGPTTKRFFAYIYIYIHTHTHTHQRSHVLISSSLKTHIHLSIYLSKSLPISLSKLPAVFICLHFSISQSKPSYICQSHSGHVYLDLQVLLSYYTYSSLTFMPESIAKTIHWSETNL